MKKQKLGNARILYKKNPINNSWMQSLRDIDMAIENHPRLQKASDEFHIYFFRPSDQLDVSKDELWVAREVAGFISSGELENIDTYDLAAGISTTEELSVTQELELSDFFKTEQNMRKAAVESFPDTWRVSFIRKNELITARIGLF